MIFTFFQNNHTFTAPQASMQTVRAPNWRDCAIVLRPPMRSYPHDNVFFHYDLGTATIESFSAFNTWALLTAQLFQRDPRTSDSINVGLGH